jgi:subtilisin family serine protease
MASGLGSITVVAESPDHRLLARLDRPAESPEALEEALSGAGDEGTVTAALLAPDGSPRGLTSDVVVVIRAEDDLAALAAAAHAMGGSLKTWLPGPRIVVLDAGAPEGAIRLSEAIRSQGGVLGAEPDFIRPRSSRRSSSDPRSPGQWYAEKACLPAALDITSGRSAIVIAVIDDGFDLAHEDLGGFVAAAWDFADDDATPEAGPLDDHGTAVLGIAAARGDNGRGITGFCPGCSVLPIRRGMTDADDARAIAHATDAGADVINCSWGYSYPSIGVTAALRHAVTDGRGGLGAVVLFAAGNEGVDIDGSHDIAATPGVLAVMATDTDDRLLPGSNTGALAIAAPSGGSLTTDRTLDGYAVGPYTSDFGGTSGAAPVVAGTAGLILSVDPTLSAGSVLELLRATAEVFPGREAADADFLRVHTGRAVARAARAPDPTELGDACSFRLDPAEDETGDTASDGCAVGPLPLGGAPTMGAWWIVLVVVTRLWRRVALGRAFRKSAEGKEFEPRVPIEARRFYRTTGRLR